MIDDQVEETVIDDQVEETVIEDIDVVEPVLDDEGNEIPAEPVIEYEDIEIDGKQYSLPKELKDSVMKNADYTQKTQELAESKRQFDESQAQFNETQQRKQAQFKSYTELSSIDSQIEQYKNVDWAVLQQQDPNLAQQHQFNLIQLQNQRQEKAGQIQQQEQQFSIQQQESYAKRAEENGRVIAGEIEGWSEETFTAVSKHASELGFSPKFIEVCQNGAFPEAIPMIRAVHKANLYDQLMSKAKNIKPPEVKVVPSKKVTGTKTSKKSVYSTDMSTADRIKAWDKKKAG